MLVVAALFGYKHFVKASPDQQAASASVSSLSADGGGMIPSAPTQPGPLPAQGMAGDMAPKAVVPLPAQDPASAPAGPVPTVATMRPASLDALASSGGALQPASAAAASVSASSPPMASAATPPAAPVEAASTPDAPNTALIASTPATAGAPANDGKDAEIRKLRQELKRAKHALAQRRPGHHASKETVAHADVDADGGDSAASAPAAPAKKKSTHAHRNGKHKRERVEVQLGYHIKQVIPGQGWIEEEETGKQRVVAVGDKIGTAEVTRIDADNYKIYTTAGVIQ
ncbi:hypothetical protein [Burkholderia ubonensis]|uniref:hypothetical protein n=1 Tax=Burkholderia ubonensis TaxID=101571 RepID=UPI0010552D30|nr:hypothetical protein [Burkholderia ubonensis]